MCEGHSRQLLAHSLCATSTSGSKIRAKGGFYQDLLHQIMLLDMSKIEKVILKAICIKESFCTCQEIELQNRDKVEVFLQKQVMQIFNFDNVVLFNI